MRPFSPEGTADKKEGRLGLCLSLHFNFDTVRSGLGPWWGFPSVKTLATFNVLVRLNKSGLLTPNVCAQANLPLIVSD